MMINEKPEKFKILIIVPRYKLTNKKDYLYTFPLGLAYISSILKEQGYEVDNLNINHHNGTISEIIKKTLDKKKYDFIGTGNNALGYSTTKIIIESIKKHPSNPKIILGGPIITTQPELYFKDLKPDFGIIGEGEKTIIDLLETIKNKKDLSNIKGLIYKDNEKTISNKEVDPPYDLDTLPYPDFEGLGFEEYLDNLRTNMFHNYNPFDNPRTYPILGSRSCPFNCTFCYHEEKYRARSINSIMKELNIMIKKYKINIIILYDDCFSINRQRVIDFCRGIKEIQKQVPWEIKWSPQLIVKDVDPKLLKIMKESGCDTVSYGFESYSSKVLKSMKKPITPEQIDFAFKETLKAGMAIQANFIFGDIAETKETAKTTLDYWKKNAKGQIWLGFIYPYPGSEIYKHCVRKGIIKNEINFIKDFSETNILNMTNEMSNKEFKKLIREVLNIEGKYCKFVVPSIKKIKKETYDVKTKCPYCKEPLVYKNCFIENPHSYSFNLVCRKCKMRFFVASYLRKFFYKYHGNIKDLRDLQLKTKNYLKKLKVILSN